MKSIVIYESESSCNKIYTLEKTHYTPCELMLYYNELDVERLLKEERGWEIGYVLNKLVLIDRHRKGREEIKKAFL